MDKKNLALGSLDHGFQRIEVLSKGFFASLGYAISGIGFAADESFLHFHKAVILQALQVAGQVAVGYLQQFFQVVVADGFIHHQGTHDAQPDTAVKHLVEVCYVYR